MTFVTIFPLCLGVVAIGAFTAAFLNRQRRRRQDAIRQQAWEKMVTYYAVKSDRTLLIDLASMRRPANGAKE